MAMINNANDVLFDLCTRLRDNGVVAKVSGDYEFSEDNISLDFVERISELDFTEHDKWFKGEINRLKENIKERDSYIKQLEHNADELKENNATVELPFDAIEVANFLINEEYECNIPFVRGKTKCRKYEIEDLKQIAEHLLVYCKHNKEGMMNMCEFCDGREKRIENGFTYGNAHIAKNNFGYSYSLRYDNSVNEYGEGTFEINYCPICGRKLVEYV